MSKLYKVAVVFEVDADSEEEAERLVRAAVPPAATPPWYFIWTNRVELPSVPAQQDWRPGRVPK